MSADGLPWGLLLEMERHRFDVGVASVNQIPYRARQPDDRTVFLDVASGRRAVDHWRAVPGAVELGSVDYPIGGPIAVFMSRPAVP
jgi:hypothetical protein